MIELSPDRFLAWCRIARPWLLAFLTLVVRVAACPASENDPRTSAPFYKSILDEKADYHGPGRGAPDPQDIAEIGIGFFAPHHSKSPIGTNLYHGVTLAIEKANAEGGCRGKPFRLVCRWADNPWGAGSQEMTRLVYQDNVWAIIGSIDGASTHIAEQIAVKARITLISPLSGDSSLTHTAVPWMFRLPPDDRSVAETLAKVAIPKMGVRRIVLLNSTDHDGRAGAAEISTVLRRYRVAPLLHLTFDPSQTDFSQQINRVSSASADGIALWGLPDPSLRLLIALREQGIKLPVFAPPGFSLPSSLDKAGAAAEGLVTCRLTWGTDESGSEEFAAEYRSRFREKPSDDAILGYDSATMVIEAVRKAGLNRARIRDAIAEMSGFIGLAGKVLWDNGGGNIAVPQPVQLREGHLGEINQSDSFGSVPRRTSPRGSSFPAIIR